MAGKLVICFLLFLLNCGYGLKLEQVLILGRHNIRSPLTEDLQKFSPYTWPIWNEDVGHLTSKGALFEENLGKYISDWFKKENLLSDPCPSENSVRIYANTKQRTRESAKAFVNGAFKNCNVTVFSKDSEEMDPIFNMVFRNTSTKLKDVIINEMKEKINHLELHDTYLKLKDVINLKESTICKNNKLCSFTNETDTVFYEIDEEPNVVGPLRHTNSIVDSFLMCYYQGMPQEEIAWGRIDKPEQWNDFIAITKENLNVRFNSTTLAREVANPMLNYIYDILSNNTYKFTLLAGHDSNLVSVIAAIGIKPYQLPDQNEITPVGSKLIFQKWHSDDLKKDFLKISFVYQTTKQLRDGLTLSKDKEPKVVNMELKTCPLDDNGYYTWECFIRTLSTVI